MKRLAPLTLALLLLPTLAGAEVCDKDRPGWDGLPVTPVQEALTLFFSPLGLVLLAATLIAWSFRSQWGALIVVLGWTGFVSLITMLDPTGTRDLARAEGCIGSPALFIGLVIAICGAMILMTAPPLGRRTDTKDN